jgi:hypothetical protein
VVTRFEVAAASCRHKHPNGGVNLDKPAAASNRVTTWCRGRNLTPQPRQSRASKSCLNVPPGTHHDRCKPSSPDPVFRSAALGVSRLEWGGPWRFFRTANGRGERENPKEKAADPKAGFALPCSANYEGLTVLHVSFVRINPKQKSSQASS